MSHPPDLENTDMNHNNVADDIILPDPVVHQDVELAGGLAVSTEEISGYMAQQDVTCASEDNGDDDNMMEVETSDTEIKCKECESANTKLRVGHFYFYIKLQLKTANDG